LYLTWAGLVPDPQTYTRSRLENWLAKMTDPQGELNPVRVGNAFGWRVKMTYEDGSIPVGTFQVLYAHGWEYSMGCALGYTHLPSSDRLTLRFLDSLRTPA